MCWDGKNINILLVNTAETTYRILFGNGSVKLNHKNIEFCKILFYCYVWIVEFWKFRKSCMKNESVIRQKENDCVDGTFYYCSALPGIIYKKLKKKGK